MSNVFVIGGAGMPITGNLVAKINVVELIDRTERACRLHNS